MADVKPVITYSPDDTKGAIRRKIWDHIEANDLANFPRPVHNRIPNVKDANLAADQAKGLQVFQLAKVVKINPDKPQEQARFLVLEENKILLVPTPKLKEGLVNRITPPADHTKEILRICSTSQGIKEYSSSIELDSNMKIDLIILGAVAVSPKGWRIGKGEGFADLEYGMMRSIGMVDENTPIITTVHDCQVMDLPDDLFENHDVTVDWVVTPTRVIQCEKKSKPTGIYWSRLTRQKLNRIPVLKKLRERERDAGVDVRIKNELERGDATTEGSDEDHQEEGSGDRQRIQRRKRMSRRGPGENPYSVFVGRFPKYLRASDFKLKVKESCDPVQVIWRGRNGYAFLVFDSQEKCDTAVEMLQGLAFNGKQVKVELADGRTPSNGPLEGGGMQSEESGNESRSERPQGRRYNVYRRRQRGGGAVRGTGRRRLEASDHDEYDTAEDGEAGESDRPRRMRPRGRVDPSLCVFMGSLPRTTRASEFKAKVRENNVNPIRVVWRGRNRYALLQFVSSEEASLAFKTLSGFEIDGKELSVQESTGVSSRPRDEIGDGEDPPMRGGRGGGRPPRRGGVSRRRVPSDLRDSMGEGSGGEGPRRPRYQRRRREQPLSSVYVGNLPKRLRISDFKTKVRDQEIRPTRLQWRGNQGHAFLQFDAQDKAEECIRLLQGLSIQERPLTVEMSTKGLNSPHGEDGPPQPPPEATTNGHEEN